MNLKFKPLRLIGKGSWFCEECLTGVRTSHPIKTAPTPHCLVCGKHHPMHQTCDGKMITDLKIEYLQLFYSIPHPKNSVGIG